MRHKLFKFEQSPRGYRFPSTFVRGTAGEAANAEGIIEATHPAQLSVHSIVATAATESQAFSAGWWVALVTRGSKTGTTTLRSACLGPARHGLR